MTHHASTRRLGRGLLLVPCAMLLVSALAGCGDDDGGTSDPPTEQLTSTLQLVVRGASAVRGVQADVQHSASVTVLDAVPAAVLAGGACEENVESQRLRLACASGADVTPPFTAWTLQVRHAQGVDPAAEFDVTTCSASGPTGSAVAVTCTVE